MPNINKSRLEESTTHDIIILLQTLTSKSSCPGDVCISTGHVPVIFAHVPMTCEYTVHVPMICV